MDRLGGRGGDQPPHFRGRPVTSKEAANANEYFEPFLNATTLKSILGYHRSMCEYLHLKPNVFTHFYPKLRANLNTWRAKALWKKFDTRAAHKCYGKGKICAGTKVLIIGAGPCGLRTAIEAQLLGAKVVVIEKRDRLSRNNVLHLWPFVIEDLRMLGAKKFFGKFCAGSIDHISIRQLQCVLLKAALILGVEIHTEVAFEGLIEPSATDKTGWRAEIQPAAHPVSQYEFDVIIGADGKRNTLQGFKRKEFRGKLAIAITANFINKKTEAEAQVEEISGVAFIFNQKFFKDLHAETRIDLENIVYYKDDTHYFVMTAKKASLLEKGVIKQDLADTEKLLAPDNVDRDALQNYARQAADFSTNYKLPDLDFAVNHYGQPDVAMFDFTSMYAAEFASKVVERNGHRLLMILVGDSLLEPFWPTGSGCARGFLSSLDAAWAIRSWSMGTMTPLDVLAERESIYRLLAQTTPDNLNKDWKSYTLDPSTRYPNLNKRIVQAIQTTHQYDTDNQENIEKMKRASSSFEVSKKRRRGNVDNDVLLTWLGEQLRDHEDIQITDLASVFKDGKVLCAIIHHYRPDMIDYHSAIGDNEPSKSNQLAIDILEKDLGIPPIVTGEEITNTEDYLAMASYLTQVYDTFRGEIPHIKHPKLVQTTLQDGLTDITSVTRQMHKLKKKGDYDDIKVEERTDCIKCEGPSSEENFIETMKKMREGRTPLKTISKFSPQFLANAITGMKSTSAPPTSFSVIVESEENELPDTKRSELSFKTLKTAYTPMVQAATPASRPSSRHKRHAEAMTQKVNSMERKNRKRRTLDRIGPSVVERQKVLEEIEANRNDRMSKRKQQRQRQTEQFLKSMQMLQANAKPDHSQPFEDYSIFLYRQTAPKFKDRVKDLEKQFTYIPDHENRHTGLKPLTNTNAEEDIASKIKSLEDRWTTQQPIEKKPKDLMRAIGKIETSDWNIKEIEKKILENKIGKPSSAKRDKERVPRWSKEEFRARQTKMEKKHLEPQDSGEEKYAEIDKNIKHLELKLKEGTSRDLGQNKVASITEKLVSKVPQKEKVEHVEKPVSKPALNLPVQSASENCHFCGKRVYLMERLSAEGRFFHNGCFKCQYCHTQLRLGSYSFDRDGHYGHKFFCIHHYGMQGELPQPIKLARKHSQRTPQDSSKSIDNKHLTGVKGFDLLDRVQTPERIEFANLSAGNLSSDHEEPLSQMDEDEWTDKNFGASCAELDDSEDESSSSLSGSDSDDEDAYDDAIEEPATKEGTMKWAERWKNSYRKRGGSESDSYSSSDHSSYYENSSDDSDSETATEGEEEIRARELRQQEVRVQPPIVQADTGTDTEVISDESSSESSSEVQNSATEISTDSEFAQDDPTPTREIPSIVLNDFNVTKTRGSGNRNYPKKIQVTTGFIGKTTNGARKPDIELKLTPLVPKTFALKKPTPALLPRTEGYALNRTQSTGGIAAKVSLELKKRYLLGESGTGAIQKSGSASTLDTKFKSFQSTISDCQKLLKPASEISVSMQVFCNKLDERHSPILSPKTNSPFFKDDQKENKQDKALPPPDITITTLPESKEEKNQQNESEKRPRSPIHEASIPVPNIMWQKQDEVQTSDSLSVSDSSSENELQLPNFQFENIPRVEVHPVNQENDIQLDSLCPTINNEKVEIEKEVQTSNIPPELINKSHETSKSVSSEKKSLNQPKSLPNLENTLPEIHKALHVKLKEKEFSPDDNKSSRTASGKSTPEGTAALTETELSDWARDGNVSDDIEFDFSQGSDKKQVPEKTKDVNNKTAPVTNMFETNLDSIEFMDTGTETSSDDGIVDSQNGYVLFKDEDDLIEDSLNPNINEILEARNIYLSKKESDPVDSKVLNNTGFCIADTTHNKFGSEVIDLKPVDLEKLKQKQSLTDHEEDSLLVVETGTTTEENTCSDSTVKNITEIAKDSNKEKSPVLIESFQKQRLEEKLAKVKAEAKEQRLKESNKKENLEFEEHCQRLQSKIEFGNAKDSIDIRKFRRKSKTDIPNQPDLIQEEKEKHIPIEDITLNLSPVICASDALYKKENIKKERDVNQKLIQEMVMNKMKAENKFLERKKRNRTSASNLSPSRPFELSKSSTTDSVSKINLNNLERNFKVTPDLLSSSVPLQNSQSPNINFLSSSLSPKTNKHRPLSVFSTFTDFKNPPEPSLVSSENCSMPDIRKNLFAADDTTPKAPPRYNRPSDITRTAERLKETARARARLLSNEDLGLSPEDRINRLKDKFSRKAKDTENVDPLVQESIESLVLNTERRNSLMYSNDTLTKKKNGSFRRSKSGECEVDNRVLNSDDLAPTRTKSIPEIPKKFATPNEEKSEKKICKSDSNLLEVKNTKPTKEKKSKDRERRKSITKLISNIFTKKIPNGSKENRGIFSKLSPKSKAISKSCSDLDLLDPDKTTVDENDRRKSLSEINIQKRDPTPPPIPPLPANYTIKGTDDSSDGEPDWKRQDRSSCDTLNQSSQVENSVASLSGRKSGKVRRVSRQSQLKRHRMAQEIQRKLEETEVKTRELEQRGVEVEKLLRGESSSESCRGAAERSRSEAERSRHEAEGSQDEAELLQEWFDLMRDRTELRRYEKELMVRAQEVELEDRHARLQAELRERLDSNVNKTEEDVRTEESIINEMMDIVAQRDSLIAVLEEDRLRYSNEDRDLEEQMLAKGLRLTPIRKTPEK